MSYIVRIEQEAQEDFIAAKDYYLLEAGADVAGRFTDATEAVFQRLASMPLAGWLYQQPLNPKLEGVRVRKMPGFPYLVFYQVEGSEVLVLAVLHRSRDIPGVLRDRFPTGDE